MVTAVYLCFPWGPNLRADPLWGNGEETLEKAPPFAQVSRSAHADLPGTNKPSLILRGPRAHYQGKDRKTIRTPGGGRSQCAGGGTLRPPGARDVTTHPCDVTTPQVEGQS